MCLGPAAAIIVNLLIVFAVFGICTLYMILFSNICQSLFVPEVSASMSPDEI